MDLRAATATTRAFIPFSPTENKSPKIIIKDASAAGVDRAIVAPPRRGSSYHAGHQRIRRTLREKKATTIFRGPV